MQQGPADRLAALAKLRPVRAGDRIAQGVKGERAAAE